MIIVYWFNRLLCGKPWRIHKYDRRASWSRCRRLHGKGRQCYAREPRWL